MTVTLTTHTNPEDTVTTFNGIEAGDEVRDRVTGIAYLVVHVATRLYVVVTVPFTDTRRAIRASLLEVI